MAGFKHPLLVAILFAVVGSFAATASAAGRPPQPPGNAATSVYVEQIPTGSGSVVAAAPVSHGGKLAPAVAEKIQRQAGTDEAALKALATSGSLGAPASKAQSAGRDRASPGSSPAAGGGHGERSASAGNPGASAGNPGAPSGGVNSRMILLGLALALISVAFALQRLRGRDGPVGEPDSGPPRS